MFRYAASWRPEVIFLLLGFRVEGAKLYSVWSNSELHLDPRISCFLRAMVRTKKNKLGLEFRHPQQCQEIWPSN